MSDTPPSLSIVVPCYNEGQVFPYCLRHLEGVLRELITAEKISPSSYILFIDDGSKDTTWQQIHKATQRSLSPSNPAVHGVKLSRNYGHQTALMAGLSRVNTDISISIDADLQDDIHCIALMIEKYQQGSDIVYGVRKDRSNDTIFKRSTAELFYKIMELMGVKQVSNHADFRLLSRRALQALLSYKENMRYIRGIVPLLGYPSERVFYKRKERTSGETKYPLSKMLSLSLEAITSLTITPLRVISALGLLTCLLSGVGGVYVLIKALCGATLRGWASIELSIFFLGGIQLLSLGIIGEYVGRIYLETKKRPSYFIEEEI
ncbi:MULTISPECIES: glycosyltransferase family 2 protein [unclassified Saccharibacter]|uniref:glycosyltransferase family 2 protein n=1 Tax=unclassified Saccharibacter TaxID=2648722 RepID=UPI00132AEA3A|nr:MULTISPECIES: glycosyltransferase family 2 protein [unclassified Saccharibacter]MXV36942.1 glycosyltransferase [Saccharibacter sp. EH611]MXV58568.1 glycosyltransferase [Saccharibacter sp. EH70]MXV66074.1 glycosyltransferase [Saccharibacter sp. EH60]